MNAVRAVISDDLSPVAIGDVFLQARATHAESVQYLIKCGRRLRLIRSKLKHGEWLRWLELHENALGFGERTARRMIAAGTEYRTLTTALPPDEAAKVNRKVWGNDRPRKPKAVSNETRSLEPSSEQRSPANQRHPSATLASDPTTAAADALDREALRMLTARVVELELQVDQLLGENERLKAENEALKERIALMEEST